MFFQTEEDVLAGVRSYFCLFVSFFFLVSGFIVCSKNHTVAFSVLWG